MNKELLDLLLSVSRLLGALTVDGENTPVFQSLIEEIEKNNAALIKSQTKVCPGTGVELV